MPLNLGVVQPQPLPLLGRKGVCCEEEGLRLPMSQTPGHAVRRKSEEGFLAQEVPEGPEGAGTLRLGDSGGGKRGFLGSLEEDGGGQGRGCLQAQALLTPGLSTLHSSPRRASGCRP